jgi:hypothetical protein
LSGCYAKTPEKTGLEGKPLPAFNLLLADSITHINTKSQPVGSASVLFFFGPHCPYSQAQMEDIVDHIDQLKDIHFYVLTVGSFSDMKAFYKHYKLEKYPNITTGIDYAYFFPGYFNPPGVPYMAIYGKDKKLKGAYLGEVSEKQIRSLAKS